MLLIKDLQVLRNLFILYWRFSNIMVVVYWCKCLINKGIKNE